MKSELADDRVALIVRRLQMIYRRIQTLQDQKDKPASPRIISATLWSGQRPLSRIASVKDAVSGLEYAAWCMGVSLMAFGGLDLMQRIYAAVAVGKHGPRISSWLDHRWNDVTDGVERWSS